MCSTGNISGDLAGHVSALTPLLSQKVDSNTGWVWPGGVGMHCPPGSQSFHQCAGRREQLPGTVGVK